MEQPEWAAGVRRDVEESLEDLRTALTKHRQDADAAETALRGAEKRLLRLATFDLVLQEASEASMKAYRAATLGHKEDAMRELGEVQKLLAKMAEGRSERVAVEFETTLKLLGDTQAALETQPQIPVGSFEDLLRRLHQMSLKGSIFLGGT